MNLDAAPYDVRINDNWSLNLKRRWQIIPSAVLGWKMNEKTALYAKFGAGISKFRLALEAETGDEKVKSERVIHFVPALGAEYEVHKNVGIRFEFSGEFFGKDIKSGFVASPNLSQTSKVSYSAVSAKIGILIKV